MYIKRYHILNVTSIKRPYLRSAWGYKKLSYGYMFTRPWSTFILTQINWKSSMGCKYLQNSLKYCKKNNAKMTFYVLIRQIPLNYDDALPQEPPYQI